MSAIRLAAIGLVALGLTVGVGLGCIANPTPHPHQDAGTLSYGGGTYKTDSGATQEGDDDGSRVDPSATPGAFVDAVLSDSLVPQDQADVFGGFNGAADAEGPAPDASSDGADAEVDGAGEASEDDDDETGSSAGGAPSPFDGDPSVEQ